MRSRAFKGWLFAALFFCASAIASVPAVATEGSCPDPSEDTFVGDPSSDVGPGTLDIVNNTHDDTSSTITYTLTTDAGFDAEDVDHIRWEIDADDDGEFEGSLLIRGDPLEAEFVNHEDGATSTAVVEHTDGESELTASYSRSELSDIGVGDSYEYVVTTVESLDAYREDNAGPCTHALSGADPEPSPSPAAGTLTLNSSQIPQGGTISGTATGLRPGSDATVIVRSDPVTLGSVNADDEGVADFSFPLPTSVTPGTHTAEVRGEDANGNARVLSAQFEVLAVQPQVVSPSPSPTASPQNGLPQSGSPIGLSAMIALTLLVIGLTMLAVVAIGRAPTVAVYRHDAAYSTSTRGVSADVVDPGRASGSVYASQITRIARP